MFMKKVVLLGASLVLALGLFTGCGEKEPVIGEQEEVVYVDGTYYAEADEFAGSGWKDTIRIEIEDGKIVYVDWNAINEEGEDKKAASISGEYGMVERGGAVAEWHEQAEEVEKFLIETQNPAAITLDDGGYTDAVSGATMRVNGFVSLVNQALEEAIQ